MISKMILSDRFQTYIICWQSKDFSTDIYTGNEFTDWQIIISVENTEFLYISKHFFYIIEKNINIS